MSDITVFRNRDEWLQSRKLSIGASEAAAIMGESKWDTPLSIWYRKLGMEPTEVSSNMEAMEWGITLEPIIIDKMIEKFPEMNISRLDGYHVYHHPDYHFVTCTPDALQYPTSKDRESGTLQIKTAIQYKIKDWEQIPYEYQIQCQYELGVTGFSHGTIACLIGGQRLVRFDFPRDEELIGKIIESVKEFWGLIQSKTPPRPTDNDKDALILSNMYPESGSNTLVYLDQSAQKCYESLEEAKRVNKQSKKAEKLAKNTLGALIGTNSFAQLPSGQKLSYLTVNRKPYTKVVAAGSYRALKKVKGG